MTDAAFDARLAAHRAFLQMLVETLIETGVVPGREVYARLAGLIDRLDAAPAHPDYVAELREIAASSVGLALPFDRDDKVIDRLTGRQETIAETSFLMVRLEGQSEWRRAAEFLKPPGLG